MGTYATTTSIEVLMVGTTFDTATSSLCTKLITHSENVINKYLSKRYDLSSFTGAVPPLVTSLCENLTEGYMYQRMSRGGKEGMARAKALIDQAKEDLKDIAEYKLHLTDSAGSVFTESSNTAYRVLSNTEDYSNTFNEDSELNWEVDSDKLDDISDERE